MAKCHRIGGESLRFPAISADALRRKLLEAIACGCSPHRRQRRLHLQSPEKPIPKSRKKSRRIEGPDRLSELLKLDISDSGSDEPQPESGTKREMEVEALDQELQNVVKSLQSECTDRRREAAKEIRRLTKDDASAREELALLGSIPPLISMLDSNDDDEDNCDLQISSLYALLNLGIGNNINKATIVKAGAIHKMMTMLSSNTSITEAIVANFLGLSALDLNKPIIASSGAIPFLIKSFRSPMSSQSKQDSLRAIFNLSILPSNIPFLVASDLVRHLLSAIENEKDVDFSSSERALSVLSNLVAVPEGRKAVAETNEGIPILIDVLRWMESPSCQEKAAYVLMVMAHRSEAVRAAMIRCDGIRSTLLEVVLVGSVLAQKRAARMLEMLSAEKGKEVSEGFLGLSAVSALLLTGGEKKGEEEEVVSEERRAVRELVVESLESNLKRIAKRANLVRDFRPSDRVTGSSKSVPF